MCYLAATVARVTGMPSFPAFGPGLIVPSTDGILACYNGAALVWHGSEDLKRTYHPDGSMTHNGKVIARGTAEGC